MWTVLSIEGDPVFWHPSWDSAVTWAMKQGGELDILFQPYFRADSLIAVEGDIDIHGDIQ